MRKIICISIIALICSNHIFGQTINLSVDDLTKLLCKKWQIDYAMMGDMKIGKRPGATEANYEFSKDNSVIITNNINDKITKGTWHYDQSKKMVKLTVNGKTNLTVISLKEDELIILADTKDATPDDPMQIKMVYKIRTN